MYELESQLKTYYAEIDPPKRLEILNALPENENSDFLHKIYQERYSDHESKGRKDIDWWLWRCLCLQMLYGRGKFFRKFRDREVISIIAELQLNDTEKNHVPFLYHEYKNVIRRYLSTCNSPNYASSFMGLRQASDERKILKACSDVWQMSEGIARNSGTEEKMRLWRLAAYDELIEYSSICQAEYERLNTK